MSSLLASQRQEQILALLNSTGGVRVSELTAAFQVSDMTIRRDIEELAAKGLAARVHGGAVPAQGTAEEPGFDAKSTINMDAKNAIGREAARLVGPGQSAAISAGTSTYWVAAALADAPQTTGMTILTNSLPVADLLYAQSAKDFTVILTGGERTPSAALVGPIADASIASLHTDLLFLGVHGIDPEAGLTTPNVREAATIRALMASATTTVVCADSTKWHTRALATIAPLDAATILITDSGISAEAAEELRRHVAELRIVS